MRPAGGRKVGLRQASSLPALAQALRAENQLLLKTWRLPRWMARESALGARDQLALNEQMAQLLSRGVPLVEALDVVAQSVRPSGRAQVLRLRDQVASGVSFAEACKGSGGGGGFDNVTIAVYRGAERSGDLAGAAKEMATTIRRRLAVAGKATTLMLYPLVVLSISLIVAVFMMLVVVPMLAEALLKSDIKLPLYSKVVFNTSLWMQGHVGLLVVMLAAVLLAILLGRRAVARGFTVLMRTIPILRDVVLAQESARFFAVMAALTRTGVPIAESLGVANQAITHPTMRKELDRLRTRLIEGGLLRVLVEEVKTLPVGTRRLLVASERTGDMESAFNTLATDMADEVDKRSSRLLAVLEPLLIVMMFLIIGSLLISIMLPMLTITSRIRG